MSGKKEYTAKNLINNSRFVYFILKIRIPKIERICVRMEEIIAENRDLCTRENFPFMSNAVTALALYEHFRNEGLSKTKAYMAVAEPMWEYAGEEAYYFYKKGKHKRSLEKFIDRIPEKLDEKYKEGWDIEIEKSGTEQISIECRACLYASFFEKYGLRDIGQMFCYADEIVYGSIGPFLFSIEECLMADDEPCRIMFRDETGSAPSAP